MTKDNNFTKDEIKQFCLEHGLLGRTSYQKAYKEGKVPKKFTMNPQNQLKLRWSSLFFSPVEEFIPYCQQNGIRTYQQYKKLYQEGKIPDCFPPNPSKTYNHPNEMLGFERTDIPKGKKKSENLTRNIFETIFRQKFPTCRPSWLIKNNAKLELDGYCAKLKLAFEYQGEYHYQEIDIHHQERTLADVQANDKFKLLKCQEKNINLIIVPFYECGNENYIIEQLQNLKRKDINDLVNYYIENRTEIIKEEHSKKQARKKARKYEFYLSGEMLHAWFLIFRDYGYEKALELTENYQFIYVWNLTDKIYLKEDKFFIGEQAKEKIIDSMKKDQETGDYDLEFYHDHGFFVFYNFKTWQKWEVIRFLEKSKSHFENAKRTSRKFTPSVPLLEYQEEFDRQQQENNVWIELLFNK